MVDAVGPSGRNEVTFRLKKICGFVPSLYHLGFSPNPMITHPYLQLLPDFFPLVLKAETRTGSTANEEFSVFMEKIQFMKIDKNFPKSYVENYYLKQGGRNPSHSRESKSVVHPLYYFNDCAYANAALLSDSQIPRSTDTNSTELQPKTFEYMLKQTMKLCSKKPEDSIKFLEANFRARIGSLDEYNTVEKVTLNFDPLCEPTPEEEESIRQTVINRGYWNAYLLRSEMFAKIVSEYGKANQTKFSLTLKSETRGDSWYFGDLTRKDVFKFSILEPETFGDVNEAWKTMNKTARCEVKMKKITDQDKETEEIVCLNLLQTNMSTEKNKQLLYFNAVNSSIKSRRWPVAVRIRSALEKLYSQEGPKYLTDQEKGVVKEAFEDFLQAINAFNGNPRRPEIMSEFEFRVTINLSQRINTYYTQHVQAFMTNQVALETLMKDEIRNEKTGLKITLGDNDIVFKFLTAKVEDYVARMFSSAPPIPHEFLKQGHQYKPDGHIGGFEFVSLNLDLGPPSRRGTNVKFSDTENMHVINASFSIPSLGYAPEIKARIWAAIKDALEAFAIQGNVLKRRERSTVHY